MSGFSILYNDLLAEPSQNSEACPISYDKPPKNHSPSNIISLGLTMGSISFSGMYTSPSGPVPRHMVEDWVREPT